MFHKTKTDIVRVSPMGAMWVNKVCVSCAQMIHDGNNAVLLIGNTYEEDTGTFTCRATTAAGQVETSAKLVVKSKT